jgi:hypothetical protein
MKKLIPFSILTFNLFILNSCVKANDNIGHDGRCTGSADCSACTNCSRCGHCSGGETCGVCGGGSSERSSSSESSSRRSKSKKHKNSDSYKSSKSKSHKPSKIHIDEVNVNINSPRYIAGISTTNIYEKPSFKSKVIEKVAKNTKLIQISKKDSWYKVQVKKGGKVGYVNYKNMK